MSKSTEDKLDNLIGSVQLIAVDIAAMRGDLKSCVTRRELDVETEKLRHKIDRSWKILSAGMGVLVVMGGAIGALLKMLT